MPLGKPLPEIRIFGVRFHPVEVEDAVDTIDGWISSQATARHVVMTGMHGLMVARRDPAFRAILKQVDLFVPDGYSLVWIARRRGVPLKRRACSRELMSAFHSRASQRGYRMFFYGDTEEVLAGLQQRLKSEFPNLQIVGCFSPPFRPLTPEEDEGVIRMINAAAPDVLWVGLGLPKQERWIDEHKHRLNVPVIVGAGAAFKFLSGQVRSAPQWMGEHGLEWLWRFAQEPQRLWRRALLDVPHFTMLVALESVKQEAMRLLRSRSLKRSIDSLSSFMGLLLALPVAFWVAVFIKLEDGGPVFHLQERVGLKGRRFLSLKFRSMVPDAEKLYGPRQAQLNDRRVTRIGRYLRATALDELPQLWNILKGDMSFVGPRALLPGEIEVNGDGSYVQLEEIPSYEARHSVRPGLTGIAQVRAPRDIPRHQKFRYDLLYINRRSLGLDLRLIATSVWISARGKWESREKKV